MMVLAGLLSALATTSGILGAYVLSARWGLSIPSGPFVILISVGLYGVSQGMRQVVVWRRRSSPVGSG